MAKNRVSVPLIEFLKNRIYLGAYDYSPVDTNELVYFTVEDALPYNAFHLDFGPLHIGNLYRFAVVLHNILNEEANQGKAIVFYSSTSPKERTNAACLLCCYMVLVQSWSPHQVLQPIAQIDPPFQGFRDAGYSSADFEITIQDIVYAMWRAKERGMIDLTSFNLEEYEQYERVDQGDFNVISKDFIAFASPQQSSRKAGLNEPFRKVLSFFIQNDVQLVVRLNSHLYDASEFTKRNIQHIDMIFDDGTCPTLEYVQKFIGAAECIINKGGKIAVHCKAGLGRTGCLIGAHLIYTHGFTANECIAYMRMIRPGMVVGPQQHWLYLHQNDFRDWRHSMVLDVRPDEFIGGLFPLCPYDEFKARMKQEAKQRKLQQQSVNSSMNQFDSSFHTPIRRRKISGALAAKIQTAVPNESPGQPRKYKDENSSGVVELINNSDEENIVVMEDVGSRKDTNYDVEEINNSDGLVLNSSPRRESPPSDWKVLRSISTNGTNQPVSLTKTTTTTTTRTVSTTLSSSPQTSPSSIKLPKSRSSSRVSSGMIQSKSPGHNYLGNRVQSAGIRKTSTGVSARKA
ncbi:protein tyrosine phosphatase CDC14 [Scheffersomyces xylosifermentans]|uniref:protein tyrosine phosphatase CDC14 n=1 Tax=Scheffersomyces xylosifermentans TaxID=1304137 RepID=UPI00315C95CB